MLQSMDKGLHKAIHSTSIFYVRRKALFFNKNIFTVFSPISVVLHYNNNNDHNLFMTV